MKRLYTAESVTEGHPDKLCDLIADSILDECLKFDPDSRVACEVLATKGMLLAAGEITSTHEPYVFEVMEKVLSDVGYSTDNIQMDALIHQQSPDIAKAVDCSREKRCGLPPNQTGWENGAGDQGVMIGYACDETPQFLPMPVVLANRIVRELTASRRSHFIEGILPDGKAQVTVEYEDGKPVRLDSVVVSCQHTEDKNLKKLEQEIKNKVLAPALRLLPSDEDTLIYITDQKLYSLQYLLYTYINQASSLAAMVKNSTGGALNMAAIATQQTPTSIRMTVSVIVVLPILFIYPMFQRFFVKGIMIGSVKG